LLIKNSPDNYPGGGNGISKIISSSYNLSGNGSVKSQIHFLKSRELANEVAKQVMAAGYLADGSKYPILWTNYPTDSSTASKAVVVSRVHNGLSVEPVEEGSNMLTVSFESYSPREAARIVNFSLNAYQDITAQKKRASALSALKFLKKKKKQVKADLTGAENDLSSFKENKNLVNLESQASSKVNAVSQLESQRQQIKTDLESAKSGIQNRKKQLSAIRPGLGEKYSQAVGPTIASYQQRLGQLKTERLILVSNNPKLKEHPDSEPKLRQLDKKIDDLQAAIKKLTSNMMANSGSSLSLLAGNNGNITNQISAIQSKIAELQIKKGQDEAQLQAINKRLQSSQGFLTNEPENAKQLARLKREANIVEQQFETVSKQASEVSLWAQTQSSAGTVIDYGSVSHTPVKPQKPLWLMGGFLLGLILPIGFLLTKEAFNKRINSIQNFKERELPLLAVIYHHSLLDKSKTKKISKAPENKKKGISDDLILYHYGLSPIAEAYRNLVSKILYSNPDNPPKTILITSSDEGEGKTTLTSNMAMALTETGNRVLIIDCDMRKSGLPDFMGISDEPGIMDILFKDFPPQKAVKKMPIPGLDVLTTGKKQPARPMSVIGSQSFKRMIKEFKSEYDFILFDSAPFGIIGDTAPILHMTDGVIVTARFLETKHVELNHTIEELKNNSAQILGLVLNGYNPRKSIDDTEVQGLYTNKYSKYYDYH
jgi:capsular exopolysaccharide synthesis family protein